VTPDVWVVVLNYNGREDTLALLATLVGQPATVLVVDNESSDDSIAAVHAAFPAVRTLATGANLGYSGGNNAGIELAMAHGAEVVVVINNDTLVEMDFLSPLVAAVADGPVAATPDIRYASDRDTSWYRGAVLDRTTARPRHLQPHEQSADRDPIPTGLLTGCCIAASTRTWRAVGLFDDDYFLIFEDSDWSMRAHAAGITTVVVPESRLVHKVSRSFRGSTDATYFFTRNGLRFSRRYLGWRGCARFTRGQIIRPLAGHVSRAEWAQVSATVAGGRDAITRCGGPRRRIGLLPGSMTSGGQR
jgi:GT2 family glycosyltransferase